MRRALLSALAILAAAVWLGGMLALGAIAAPVVFGVVPAPLSADAMTVVFRRFDSVAMACAAIVLVVEGGRVVAGVAGEAIGRLDAARVGAAVVAGALAIVEGVWISPAIEQLHRAGAVRGYGAAGLELEAKHRLAEMDGKAQALLLAALIVMHVVTVGREGIGKGRG